MDVVVILSPGFPKDEADTACLPAVQQFVLSIKKQFPQTPLIILSLQYPFEAKEYEWNGLKVISLGGKNKPRFSRFFIWLKAYRQLKKINRKNRIVGALSLWLTESALISGYFSRRHNIKHYTWLFGQDAKASNRYVRLIRPKAEEMIAMSEFIREEFYKNHGQQPFLVAENGINASIFPEFNAGNRSITLLGVGSLIPLKNYSLFIELVSELKPAYPGILAVIAGAGPQKEQLALLVKQLGLQDQVRFTGSLPHAEILSLMADSRIFLHTSDFEGNSTVMMEALYSGCTVVSKTGLSTKETKNLWVMESRTELKEALLRLLNEAPAAERVVFNTMDKTAARIMDLFLK